MRELSMKHPLICQGADSQECISDTGALWPEKTDHIPQPLHLVIADLQLIVVGIGALWSD